jgi:hypothetical protein
MDLYARSWHLPTGLLLFAMVMMSSCGEDPAFKENTQDVLEESNAKEPTRKEIDDEGFGPIVVATNSGTNSPVGGGSTGGGFSSVPGTAAPGNGGQAGGGDGGDGNTTLPPLPPLPPDNGGNCTPGAPDGIITFEELTNHTRLSQQYANSHGIVLAANGNQAPQVGEVGGSCAAYGGGAAGNVMEGWVTVPGKTCDQLVEGAEIVGRKFLTTASALSQSSTQLRIDFARPTQQFSFSIVDIDAYEKFEVSAFAGNVLVDKLVLCGVGAPTAGTPCTIKDIRSNSKPYNVEFADPSGEDRITRVAIRGIKPNNFEIGVAFDRFSPRRVCR